MLIYTNLQPIGVVLVYLYYFKKFENRLYCVCVEKKFHTLTQKNTLSQTPLSDRAGFYFFNIYF